MPVKVLFCSHPAYMHVTGTLYYTSTAVLVHVPSGELASECHYIECLYKSVLTMKVSFSKYLTNK